MSTFDFSEITIPRLFSDTRVPVGGDLGPRELASRLAEEWIQYYECHKCGRHDYCKFARELPNSHGRCEEIRCGVTYAALENFVFATFPLLDDLSRTQIHAYFDGAYHYCRLVWEAEVKIGGLMDRGFIDFLGPMAPTFFGGITSLREHLDRLAHNLREIPELHSARGVVFLEGQSEQAFVTKLAQSGLWPFTDLIIEVYEGSGNIKPKRIEMLLKRIVRDGYNVYIQKDADGSRTTRDPFEGKVKVSGTFAFRHDFESSVPAALLFRALQLLKEDAGVPYSDFEKAVSEVSGSVIPALLNQCKIDIEPIKVKAAAAIAEVLADPYSDWLQDERFRSSELGKFLTFLEEAYH